MSAPYDRLKAESDPAFAAFVVYRQMGAERSTAKVGQALGKSKRLIDEWSSKHGWVKRAAAWDNYLDRRLRAAEAKALEQMRVKQIKMADGLQGLGVTELRKALNRANSNPGATVSIKELIAIIDSGTKLERVNRGEPSDIVQHNENEPDLSSLSLDELRALKAIHAKVRKDNA